MKKIILIILLASSICLLCLPSPNQNLFPTKDWRKTALYIQRMDSLWYLADTSSIYADTSNFAYNSVYAETTFQMWGFYEDTTALVYWIKGETKPVNATYVWLGGSGNRCDSSSYVNMIGAHDCRADVSSSNNDFSSASMSYADNFSADNDLSSSHQSYADNTSAFNNLSSSYGSYADNNSALNNLSSSQGSYADKASSNNDLSSSYNSYADNGSLHNNLSNTYTCIADSSTISFDMSSAYQNTSYWGSLGLMKGQDNIAYGCTSAVILGTNNADSANHTLVIGDNIVVKPAGDYTYNIGYLGATITTDSTINLLGNVVIPTGSYLTVDSIYGVATSAVNADTSAIALVAKTLVCIDSCKFGDADTLWLFYSTKKTFLVFN